MTSWGGTSIAIVRKLTRTSLSIKGMMITTPGPFPPTSPRASRPHRKITARSYSRRTLNPIRMSSAAKNRIRTGLARFILDLFLLGEGFHAQPQPVNTGDFGFVARTQRLITHGFPQFAVDGQLSLGSERSLDDAHQTHHFFSARRRPASHCLHA